MSDLIEHTAWVVEEIVTLFNDARNAGQSSIQSAVGSKFEQRCRAILEAIEAAGVDCTTPALPRPG